MGMRIEREFGGEVSSDETMRCLLGYHHWEREVSGYPDGKSLEPARSKRLGHTRYMQMIT
jgi:hypothetical protein